MFNIFRSLKDKHTKEDVLYKLQNPVFGCLINRKERNARRIQSNQIKISLTSITSANIYNRSVVKKTLVSLRGLTSNQ